MKTRVGFLLALLPLSLFAGTIPGLTSKVLDNGLEVIVIENHAVPLATVEIAVKSGSFVESPDYNGLSHLYEHMFFKGNKAIPNQEKYLNRLNELGASWNGSTNTERVNYFLTLPSENLREGTFTSRVSIRPPIWLRPISPRCTWAHRSCETGSSRRFAPSGISRTRPARGSFSAA
jgi:zinc protease